MSEEATAGSVSERILNMQLASDHAEVPAEEPADALADQEPEDLDELIEQIVSENPPTRFFGIQSLRRRISDDCDVSYARLLNTKAFDVIVTCLGNDQEPDIQYECAWVLTNLLSNRQEKSDLLAKGGLCQPLVKLLSNGADRTREQACWALANIAGECAEWRDQTLVCGLLPALTALWDSKPSTGVLDATSLLMVNLFRDREPRVSFEVVKALLPYMLGLLDHPHTALVPHVVWALSYMIEDSEPRIRLLLQEDVLHRLRNYLGSSDTNLLIPTLRVFGNISSTMSLLPSCVLADGVLAKMRPLLDHPESKIRRQVLFFVSNVSDGPDSHLQQIVDAGFLQRIGLILMEADELERREAFWIVPNFVITRGSKFKSLIVHNCLEGFLEILTMKDVELTHCVLLSTRELLLSGLQYSDKDLKFDGLKKKIEHCGGLKKIELVQSMGDKELAKMSYQIIDHFFWHNGEKYASGQDQEESQVSENNSVDNDDNVQISPEPADKDLEGQQQEKLASSATTDGATDGNEPASST